MVSGLHGQNSVSVQNLAVEVFLDVSDTVLTHDHSTEELIAQEMILNQSLAILNHVQSMEHTVNGDRMVHAQPHVELARKAEFVFATAQPLQMVDEHAVILAMQKKKSHARSENAQSMVVTANGDLIVDAQNLVELALTSVSDFAPIHHHNTGVRHVKDQTIKSKNATLTHVQFTVDFQFGENGTHAQSAVEEEFNSDDELAQTPPPTTVVTIVKEHANHHRPVIHMNVQLMVVSLNGLLSETALNHVPKEPNLEKEHVRIHLPNMVVKNA